MCALAQWGATKDDELPCVDPHFLGLYYKKWEANEGLVGIRYTQR